MTTAHHIRTRARPSTRRGTGMLRAVGILAIVAAGLSAYVAWSSGAHAGLAGCGEGSGCAAALGSRWATCLGVPVSMLGTANYLLMAVVAVGASRGSRPIRRLSRNLVCATAGAAVAAAAWFTMLPMLSVGQPCRYCLAIHAIGLVLGACVIVPAVVAGHAVFARKAMCWTMAGVLATAVMAGTQIALPPATYAVRTLDVAQPRHAAADIVRPAPGGLASIVVQGQSMELSTADYPTVGPPDATHVMVLMADYTCPHCRVTHQTMARLLTNYGGQIALIVLPTPLCSACNREVPAGLGSPPVACALARLALAVWCADPRAFAPMDQWLFAEARPRTEAEARAFAVRLIGADALRRAEADPRIDHLLAANADLYGRLDRGLIPKLMWGNLIAQGAIADSWPLDEPIFRTWHIRPDGKPGASHPDAPAGR